MEENDKSRSLQCLLMKSYGCCDHLEGFQKNLRSKINQVWARFCLSFISEHPEGPSLFSNSLINTRSYPSLMRFDNDSYSCMIYYQQNPVIHSEGNEIKKKLLLNWFAQKIDFRCSQMTSLMKLSIHLNLDCFSPRTELKRR